MGGDVARGHAGRCAVRRAGGVVGAWPRGGHQAAQCLGRRAGCVGPLGCFCRAFSRCIGGLRDPGNGAKRKLALVYVGAVECSWQRQFSPRGAADLQDRRDPDRQSGNDPVMRSRRPRRGIARAAGAVALRQYQPHSRGGTTGPRAQSLWHCFAHYAPRARLNAGRADRLVGL